MLLKNQNDHWICFCATLNNLTTYLRYKQRLKTSRRNWTAPSPHVSPHPRPTKLCRNTWYELPCMSLGMLLVSFPQVLSKVVVVWLSGCVSIPGEAEGHPAVSIRWIPPAQREGNSREVCGVSTANSRAVFKTSQREAEPNGEPSVALAEVCRHLSFRSF